MLLLGMVLALLADGPVQGSLDRAPVSQGSRIRGLPEEARLPVEVLSREQLEERGVPSVADLLKQMPRSSRVARDGVIGAERNPCKRVDTHYAALPEDEADAVRRRGGATPMTRLPDADMIRAVLRSVDGRCEIVVIRQNVSEPRN